MTTGSSAMEKLDLNVDLVCSICTELFEEPKVLSCGHVFCHKCVIALVSSCNLPGLSAFKQFKCPTCRTVITMHENSSLPTVFSIKALVEKEKQLQVAAKQTQRNTIYCFSCSNKFPPVQIFICRTCKAATEIPGKLGFCSMCVVKEHNGHDVLQQCMIATPDFIEKAIAEIKSMQNDLNKFMETNQPIICDIINAQTELQTLFECADMKYKEQLASSEIMLSNQNNFYLKTDVQEQVRSASESTTFLRSIRTKTINSLPDIKRQINELSAILRHFVDVPSPNHEKVMQIENKRNLNKAFYEIVNKEGSQKDESSYFEISLDQMLRFRFRVPDLTFVISQTSNFNRFQSYIEEKICFTMDGNQVVIEGLSKLTANMIKMPPTDISMVEYFKKRYNYTIKYPDLPCAVADCTFYPLETLKVQGLFQVCSIRTT